MIFDIIYRSNSRLGIRWIPNFRRFQLPRKRENPLSVSRIRHFSKLYHSKAVYERRVIGRIRFMGCLGFFRWTIVTREMDVYDSLKSFTCILSSRGRMSMNVLYHNDLRHVALVRKYSLSPGQKCVSLKESRRLTLCSPSGVR